MTDQSKMREPVGGPSWPVERERYGSYAAGMEIPDEAVQAAYEALCDPDIGPEERTRAALEAARPFMTSRPALDREAVQDEMERLAQWADPENYVEEATDSVMALAVPVPTREQIDEVIATKVMRYDSAADMRLVDDGDVEALDAGTAAVLALLNRSES